MQSRNVCPIAVGPKRDDHQKVLGEKSLDTSRLQENDDNKFLNGKTKRKALMFFQLQVVVPDQPEHRAMDGLLSGGHGHYARFGWSFNSKAVHEKLIPCKVCVESMKKMVLGSKSDDRACSDCCHFWMNSETMQNDEMNDFPMPGPQKCQNFPIQN